MRDGFRLSFRRFGSRECECGVWCGAESAEADAKETENGQANILRSADSRTSRRVLLHQPEQTKNLCFEKFVWMKTSGNNTLAKKINLV